MEACVLPETVEFVTVSPPFDESDVQITHRRRERGNMRLRVENQGSGGERVTFPR